MNDAAISNSLTEKISTTKVKKMNTRKLSLLAFGLIGLLLFDGCVSLEPTALVRYDKDSDTFEVLSVIENIRFEHDREAQNLSQLWDRRAEWIPFHFDGGFLEFSILRDGAHQMRPWSMGNQWGDPVTVKVDLSKIKVSPGEFFTNKTSGLAYHHQYTLPGSTLDDMLKELLASMRPELETWLTKELESTEPQFTWEMVRARFKHDAGDETVQLDEPKSSEPRSPFSQETLNALVEKLIIITREGSVVKVEVPMSVADQSEVIKAFKLIKETAHDEMKESTAYLAFALETLKFTGSEERLVATLDLARERFPTERRVKKAMNVADAENQPGADKGSTPSFLTLDQSLQKLAELGVPVRKDLTIEKVLEDWK